MSERARAEELLNQLGMSERRKQIYRDGIERATEADLAVASEGLEKALRQVDAALGTADQILARQRERAAAGRKLAWVPQDDARNDPVTVGIGDTRANQGPQPPELAQPAENGSGAGDHGPAATNPTQAHAPLAGSPRVLEERRSSAEWVILISALLGDDRRKHQEARAQLWSAVVDYVVRRARLPIGAMADDEDTRRDIALRVQQKLERNDYAHLREWMRRQQRGAGASSWWGFVTVVTRYAAIDWARTERREAVQEGVRQGLEQGERNLLLHQLHRRFGSQIDAEIERRVAAASTEQMEIWAVRALSATTLAELLAA